MFYKIIDRCLTLLVQVGYRRSMVYIYTASRVEMYISTTLVSELHCTECVRAVRALTLCIALSSYSCWQIKRNKWFISIFQCFYHSSTFLLVQDVGYTQKNMKHIYCRGIFILDFETHHISIYTVCHQMRVYLRYMYERMDEGLHILPKY